DGIDVEARGGLELGEVIVEAAVAAEPDHRPIGQRALGAERRWEAPAERAGATQESLSPPGQPDHLAGPHAGVACVRQDYAAFGEPVRDLLADPLRTDRHRVGVSHPIRLFAVLAHQLLRPAEPPRSG